MVSYLLRCKNPPQNFMVKKQRFIVSLDLVARQPGWTLGRSFPDSPPCCRLGGGRPHSRGSLTPHRPLHSSAASGSRSTRSETKGTPGPDPLTLSTELTPRHLLPHHTDKNKSRARPGRERLERQTPTVSGWEAQLGCPCGGCACVAPKLIY